VIGLGLRGGVSLKRIAINLREPERLGDFWKDWDILLRSLQNC